MRFITFRENKIIAVNVLLLLFHYFCTYFSLQTPNAVAFVTGGGGGGLALEDFLPLGASYPSYATEQTERST